MTAPASGPIPRSTLPSEPPPDDLVTHLPILLKPDPTRVVIRPFMPAEDEPEFATAQHTRAQRIADRVLALGDVEAKEELHGILASLSQHHRGVGRVLLRRYHDVNGLSIAATSVNPDQAHLIGAYFSEEYAFEAAALFNPSIVPAPDQVGARRRPAHHPVASRGG
jgi:hypothetical protein